MGTCEMCGAEGTLFLTLIEGVELKVCGKCSSFGKKIREVRVIKKEKPRQKAPEREVIQVIREDFPQLIREKRERLGLKQEEFARFLAERESIVHKIEAGTFTPSIEMARKLEKQLGIELIIQKTIEPQNLKSKSQEFTIGDVLKVK